MRLGDYADGAWIFIATCNTCGRQSRVDPAEMLTHPSTHFRDNKKTTGGTSPGVTRPAARKRLEPYTGHEWPPTVAVGH